MLCLSLLTLTCRKSSPVEPAEPPPKDPRTYTWTVDTLSHPGSYQTEMLDIWGSSSTDVYTVGHNDQNSGLIWHFNGSGWSDIKLSTSQGGSIPGRIDLRAIQGFSSNDIWAVGMRIHQVSFSPPEKFLDSSLILHFDGVNWNEVRLPFSADMLWCIWGQSSSDLWMGGF